MSVLAAACDLHPDRVAIALCVRCQRPLCSTCSTRWEGMHLCAPCLGEQRRAAARPRSRLAAVAAALVVATLLLLSTQLRTLGAVLWGQLW